MTHHVEPITGLPSTSRTGLPAASVCGTRRPTRAIVCNTSAGWPRRRMASAARTHGVRCAKSVKFAVASMLSRPRLCESRSAASRRVARSACSWLRMTLPCSTRVDAGTCLAQAAGAAPARCAFCAARSSRMLSTRPFAVFTTNSGLFGAAGAALACTRQRPGRSAGDGLPAGQACCPTPSPRARCWAIGAGDPRVASRWKAGRNVLGQLIRPPERTPHIGRELAREHVLDDLLARGLLCRLVERRTEFVHALDRQRERRDPRIEAGSKPPKICAICSTHGLSGATSCAPAAAAPLPVVAAASEMREPPGFAASDFEKAFDEVRRCARGGQADRSCGLERWHWSEKDVAAELLADTIEEASREVVRAQALC